MHTKTGLFRPGEDVVLDIFRHDRLRLTIICTVLFIAVGIVMTVIDPNWQIPLVLLLYICVFWRDYQQLRIRIKSGCFGDGEYDLELLDQFFAARGTRIQKMHID